MNSTQESLRTEIDGILKNYGVPFEDRSLVFEKVDKFSETAADTAAAGERQFFNDKINEIEKGLATERQGVHKEIEGIRQSALSSIDTAQEKLDESYNNGFGDGIQLSESRPKTFQIIIGLGLLALAMVVVAGSFFGKKNN